MSQDLKNSHGVAFSSHRSTPLIRQLEDPRTLDQVLPDTLKRALADIPGDWLCMTDEDMVDMIKTKIKEEIPTIMETLRLNFWIEYDRVIITKNQVIDTQNIYAGVCSSGTFFGLIQKRSYWLAYIMNRPPEYTATINGMLAQVNRRLKDFLSIPIKKPNGEYQDPKMLELILKAAAMVDMRAKGNYLNRTETKNVTLINQTTTHTNNYTHDESGNEKTPEQLAHDIDAEIKSLEEELSNRSKLPPPSPKFVEAKVEDV